jgi:hypothetical protein
MNLAVTFQAGFTGAKGVFGYASQTTGGLNSGWQQLGTWTVPSGATQPPTESVSPSTGSGDSPGAKGQATRPIAPPILRPSATPTTEHPRYRRTHFREAGEWDQITSFYEGRRF